MSKKKIELTEEIEKMAAKYGELSNKDLNTVTNQALKAYLIDHLSPKQIRTALKSDPDTESAKQAEQFLKSNMGDLGKY